MNEIKTLLLTPPFVQLSSPYSAPAFLTGYLKSLNYKVEQIDLSILTFLKIFSQGGLEIIFDEAEKIDSDQYISDFILKKDAYIETIEPVILFLQGKYHQLSHKITSRKYLPEAKRFDILNSKNMKFKDDYDYALHLASLYIDDIADFIAAASIPYFNLSSYNAKGIASGEDFKVISAEVTKTDIFTSLYEKILDSIDFMEYSIIGITIPFPGNLYGALKTASYIKEKHPDSTIVTGGGFVNTDLTLLSDTKVFDYFDYITYDDGEIPLERIIQFKSGLIKETELVRTAKAEDGKVVFINKNIKTEKICPAPDYKDLKLDNYITLKESTNKMHSLWSEKNYMKIRMAHGCYHHKCSFCDTSLDYIVSFHSDRADNIISAIEKIIRDTKIRAFHFVDEAMPPALVFDLCRHIIRKKLDITWWGNIRFDKQFTRGLTKLMAKSGCIAVSGGIESADNDVLKLMNKNSSVENYAAVCNNFAKAGILIHGYMIYGFPGETVEQCLNSLEVIRQFFSLKIINSAFYHRFALTIHSPVFNNPEEFGITIPKFQYSTFSNNDVFYKEKKPSNIDFLSQGLEKAIYNYNHDNALELPVEYWFEGIDYKTSVKPDFVKRTLKKNNSTDFQNEIPLWIGRGADLKKIDDDTVMFSFTDNKEPNNYEIPSKLGHFLYEFLNNVSVDNAMYKKRKLSDYFTQLPPDFFNSIDELFDTEIWEDLIKSGLVFI